MGNFEKSQQLTLEQVKKGTWWPDETRVHIFSREHRAYWGSDRSGYFADPASAGEYTFAEAWRATWHCGPEKGIVFRQCLPRVMRRQPNYADIGRLAVEIERLRLQGPRRIQECTGPAPFPCWDTAMDRDLWCEACEASTGRQLSKTSLIRKMRRWIERLEAEA
ncbi:MAG: hypothetical protein AAGM22_27755 [Acidobacteriota bacterium]